MDTTVSLGVDKGALPVVDCAGCGRRSLTWLDPADDGDVVRCLSCDRPVDAAPGLVGERTVERMGYAFIDRRRAGSTKLSGCGAKGARSCGSGGCSSGSCGSGGGCGSGGCGTR